MSTLRELHLRVDAWAEKEHARDLALAWSTAYFMRQKTLKSLKYYLTPQRPDPTPVELEAIRDDIRAADREIREKFGPGNGKRSR